MTDENIKPELIIDSHIDDAEKLVNPIETIYTDVIEDEIVINRQLKKLVVRYRVCNKDSSGQLLESQPFSIVHRNEEYDQALSELFDGSKIVFAKIRMLCKKDLQDRQGIMEVVKN